MSLLNEAKENERSRRMRYLFIGVMVVIVILAFYVQSSFYTKETQQPLVASSLSKKGETEVTMTQEKDNKVYLVSYSVEGKEYHFQTKRYVELDSPITDLTYDDEQRLWMKQDDKWLRLNDKLQVMDSHEKSPSTSFASQYDFQVLDSDDTYLLQLYYNSQLMWSKNFDEKPADVTPLNSKGETWVVVLNNGDANVVK
ncbi:hypothetical protein [Pontibacillus litoralis]|uniref:Uncharacterized protein n=1 Tax=Pontibacillus litoralis JSM 072002 TaxID=1385512 RepID=A0A0A5GDL5_9BACI|nr:hypothetical protein [Pontibacillus litoralis]KGX89215.1 hypothetical protein N784_02075 [Pontibacillus litoralis JSM 072002]